MYTTDEMAEVLCCKNTPSVISIGKRCLEMGYAFYWPPYSENPFIVKPDGTHVVMTVENNIPYLTGGNDDTACPGIEGDGDDAVAETANRRLCDTYPTEHTAKVLGFRLNEAYKCLIVDVYDSTALASHRNKVCMLWIALESRSPNHYDWHVKPKLHMSQELCEFSSARPSQCWNYRDEDFGGSLAQLSRRRGGANNPGTGSLTVLQRFCLKHPLPCVS